MTPPVKLLAVSSSKLPVVDLVSTPPPLISPTLRKVPAWALNVIRALAEPIFLPPMSRIAPAPLSVTVLVVRRAVALRMMWPASVVVPPVRFIEAVTVPPPADAFSPSWTAAASVVLLLMSKVPPLMFNSPMVLATPP